MLAHAVRTLYSRRPCQLAAHVGWVKEQHSRGTARRGQLMWDQRSRSSKLVRPVMGDIACDRIPGEIARWCFGAIVTAATVTIVHGYPLFTYCD